MASITVKGNLGADPELKTQENGHSFVSFSLYENHFENGSKQEPTIYAVRCYSGTSPLMEKLQKGSEVLVTGRLRIRKAANGKLYFNILAWDVEFIGRLKASDNAAA